MNYPPQIRNIPRLLHQLRIARGLSQEELGKRSGIDFRHIGRIERGDCIPTLLTIYKLETALTVPNGFLLSQHSDFTNNAGMLYDTETTHSSLEESLKLRHLSEEEYRFVEKSALLTADLIKLCKL